MTVGERRSPTALHTVEVRVRGANCPYCFSQAMDTLRGLDGVVAVRASIVGECIEVQHRGASMPLLLETLRECLHGTQDWPHGCQMIAIEPELVPRRCGGADSTATGAPLSAPPPMESLVEAMTRLRADGFVDDFMATPEGNLACRSCGTSHDPESIEIRETVRFEGDSNPDDEAILLALTCADGCRGQYSSAFGADTPPADMRVLARLPRQEWQAPETPAAGSPASR